MTAMSKAISVTLDAHYEKFITEEIAEGRFSSASEAVLAGLRLLEERQAKITILRQELDKGEESGFVEFSLDAFLKELDKDDK